MGTEYAYAEELDLTAHGFQFLPQIPKFYGKILRKVSQGRNCALKGMVCDTYCQLVQVKH